MTNNNTGYTIAALMTAAGLALITWGAVLYFQQTDQPQPKSTTTSVDITVMPCSAWADEQFPTIPANTLTDVCVDDLGTLHTAPTSINNTVKK